MQIYIVESISIVHPPPHTHLRMTIWDWSAYYGVHGVFQVLSDCVPFDMGIIMPRTSLPQTHECGTHSLFQVRLQGLAKPSSGLSAGVDIVVFYSMMPLA